MAANDPMARLNQIAQSAGSKSAVPATSKAMQEVDALAKSVGATGTRKAAQATTTAATTVAKDFAAKRWWKAAGTELEGGGKSIWKSIQGIGNVVGAALAAPVRLVGKFTRTKVGGFVTAIAIIGAVVYGVSKLFGGKKEDVAQPIDARDSAAQLRAARVQAFSGEVNDLANEGNLARLQARQTAAEVGAGQAR